MTGKNKAQPTCSVYDVTHFAGYDSAIHFVVDIRGVAVCNHETEFDPDAYMKHAVMYLRRNSEGDMPTNITYEKGFFYNEENKVAGWAHNKDAIRLAGQALDQLIRNEGNRAESEIHSLKEAIDSLER